MRRVIACSQSKVYKWLYPRRSESSNSITDLYTCRNWESRNFWPLGYQIRHTETYNEEHLFTIYPDLDKTTAGNSKIWPPEPPTLNTGGQENRRWLIYYQLHTMHVHVCAILAQMFVKSEPSPLDTSYPTINSRFKLARVRSLAVLCAIALKLLLKPPSYAG